MAITSAAAATTPTAPTWCGVCLTGGAGGPVCPACGAAVAGPVADDLRRAIDERARLAAWRVDADRRLAGLDTRIASLVHLLRAMPQPRLGVPAPAAETTAPTTGAPRSSRTTPRAVLTWTGGVLLALAGIAFAGWAWTAVGPYGRFGMLLLATAAIALTARLVRRRTPVTAESLDVVAVVLLMVDWVVAWNVVGADGSAAAARDWVLLGCIVVGAAALGLARVTDAMVLPHLGVAVASIGLVGLPFVRIVDPGTPAGPVGLLALAVLSWTSLLPLALGRLTALRWPGSEVTGRVLGALAWLAVLVGSLSVMGTLVGGGVQGAAVSVAALGVPATCVVAWTWLPVATRERAWTAVHGVAAAAGAVLAMIPIARETTLALDRLSGSAGDGIVPWLTAAIVGTVLVAAAIGLLRLAPSSPARTGALVVLATSSVAVIAIAELGVWLAVAAPDGSSTAVRAIAAGVALALAGPAVLAALAAPRPGTGARELRWLLGAAATAALWSPALLLLAAAAVPLTVSGQALLLGAATVAATAGAVALARRPATAPSGVTALGAVGLALSSGGLAVAAGGGHGLVASLLGMAAVTALVWRAGAGTWLLPRPSAPAIVAGATALGLVAVGVLVATWLPAGTALTATAAASVAVWLVCGNLRPIARSGAVGGAAATALATVTPPAVVALAAPLLVPVVRAEAGIDLPLADLAGLVAAVGAWAVLAATAALAASGTLLRLPARVPARVRSAAPSAAAVSTLLAILVLVTATDLPGWVPAAVLVGIVGGSWVVVAAPRTGATAQALATTAAVGAGLLAAGWAQPLTWGPTVLAVTVTATAGLAATRTRGGIAMTATGVAALAAVLVAPLALAAGASAAAGVGWLALSVAAGAAVLLAAAPSLPTTDPARVVAGGVGALAAATGALTAPDARTVGLALVLWAAALLLAARRWSALRYAAVAVTVAAGWAFLADAGATVLEAWTAPLALGLLVMGLLLARDPRRPHLHHPSWLTTGPALLVMVVPSAAVLVAGDAPTWRIAGLAALGAVALVAGAGRHEQAPTVLGAVALLAVAVQVLGPVVAATPLWVVLAAAGAFLTWVGFTWERRRDQARHAVEGWARFV